MYKITNITRFYIVEEIKNSIVSSIYSTTRFLRLNLTYFNFGIARYPNIRMYSVIWSQFPDARNIDCSLIRTREKDNCLPSRRVCFKRNVFYAIRDFRRVHKFENSFAWQISILLRFRSTIPLTRGMALHQLFPLLHVLPCHSVLTRKPIYSDDNIDADPGRWGQVPWIWFWIIPGSQCYRV